jgi:glycosyltransferase involved in cell wall biosynthesis
VASVALSCCRQAVAVGHDVTLLMALAPSGHLDEYVEGFDVDSLTIESESPVGPERLVAWLRNHPQDVLFVNKCGEAEPALPYIPQRTTCIYVVHDTALMYWETAVEHEAHLDAIVAVSEAVAGQFREHLQEPERLHVVHNGTVMPSQPEENERTDDILFLGGSQPLKGRDDVLGVWRALVEREFDGCLHWYGRINDRMRRRIESLPAAERVVTHGRVPRSDIFDRAARSKVLLMLSRDEPFGMATVEAMGMGCLPVAWDIDTGTQEIVENGETGFFAPLGDVDAAANRVLDGCRWHDDLSTNAMQVARSRFSEEAMWERYAGVLEALEKQSPVARPKAGGTPPQYEPPTRYFQLLPDGLRTCIRSIIGRFPKLERKLRGWKGI